MLEYEFATKTKFFTKNLIYGDKNCKTDWGVSKETQQVDISYFCFALLLLKLFQDVKVRSNGHWPIDDCKQDHEGWNHFAVCRWLKVHINRNIEKLVTNCLGQLANILWFQMKHVQIRLKKCFTSYKLNLTSRCWLLPSRFSIVSCHYYQSFPCRQISRKINQIAVVVEVECFFWIHDDWWSYHHCISQILSTRQPGG